MKAEIKEKWKVDKSRYPKRPWLQEPSIIAVYWMRHGQSVDLMKDGLLKKCQLKIYWLIFHLLELLVGVSISKSVKVGAGLRIYHFGNIFVHKDCVIGENVTLRQGVTIGNKKEGGKVPTIGDHVETGAYAQILGDVYVGEKATIGALAVVTKDIPDGATAVGVPAKILQ